MNLTSGFLDLATFSSHPQSVDEALYMYSDTSTYQGQWCTHVPTPLKEKSPGIFTITRGGDVLMYLWLDIVIISCLKWVKNLAHNLFESIELKCDSNTIQRFDSYTLDFLANFNTDINKREAYYKIINAGARTDKEIRLCLPIPINYLLPMASVGSDSPITLEYKLKTLDKVLTEETVILQPEPVVKINAWANYRILSSATRKRLQRTNHKVIIDQYQTYKFPLTSLTPTFELPADGCVKTIYYGTTRSPSVYDKDLVSFGLKYGNTDRVLGPSHHTSFVFPFYQASSINDEGMHMYTYSDSNLSNDEKCIGHTNYGSLLDQNISTTITPVYTEDYHDRELIVVVVNRAILQIFDGKIIINNK